MDRILLAFGIILLTATGTARAQEEDNACYKTVKEPRMRRKITVEPAAESAESSNSRSKGRSRYDVEFSERGSSRSGVRLLRNGRAIASILYPETYSEVTNLRDRGNEEVGPDGLVQFLGRELNPKTGFTYVFGPIYYFDTSKIRNDHYLVPIDLGNGFFLGKIGPNHFATVSGGGIGLIGKDLYKWAGSKDPKTYEKFFGPGSYRKRKVQVYSSGGEKKFEYSYDPSKELLETLGVTDDGKLVVVTSKKPVKEVGRKIDRNYNANSVNGSFGTLDGVPVYKRDLNRLYWNLSDLSININYTSIPSRAESSIPSTDAALTVGGESISLPPGTRYFGRTEMGMPIFVRETKDAKGVIRAQDFDVFENGKLRRIDLAESVKNEIANGKYSLQFFDQEQGALWSPSGPGNPERPQIAVHLDGTRLTRDLSDSENRGKCILRPGQTNWVCLDDRAEEDSQKALALEVALKADPKAAEYDPIKVDSFANGFKLVHHNNTIVLNPNNEVVETVTRQLDSNIAGALPSGNLIVSFRDSVRSYSKNGKKLFSYPISKEALVAIGEDEIAIFDQGVMKVIHAETGKLVEEINSFKPFMERERYRVGSSKLQFDSGRFRLVGEKVYTMGTSSEKELGLYSREVPCDSEESELLEPESLGEEAK